MKLNVNVVVILTKFARVSNLIRIRFGKLQTKCGCFKERLHWNGYLVIDMHFEGNSYVGDFMGVLLVNLY
jgi:hypothetical protein